ncbi:MAG TPA: hypothetical protein VGR71_11815 [Nitrospira sp.]|nr:hypothetical protein [Nitrospira sp.]
MSRGAEVIELARAKSVTLDRTGGVRLPDLTPKQKKELLGAEIGTAFDMYTRMFAAFSGGDVFEIGEWRVRDLDSMLSRDGTAKALEQVLTLPLRSAAYTFQAADGDTGELDLILEHFASPSEAVAAGNLGVTTGPVGACSPGLRTILGQMSMASIYRKAFFEKRYIMDEHGIIRLTDLAWRPPATCEVKRDEHTAKFDGFRQRAWWFFSDPSIAKKRFAKEWGKNFTGYLDIPKQRSFVYIHGQHRQPLTGISDMDVPYWVYKQKLKLMFLWWQFLENQSLPKLAAYGADQDQADDNADALASMRSSAVGGFIRPPSGQKLFDIIEASGAGAAQFRDALNFLDNFQTLSVLAGFLNLPSAAMLGRGSYALSESQTDFFNKSRQGVLYEMQEAFTRDVTAPIIILNRGPMAAIPRLTSSKLSAVDNAQILSVFNLLMSAPALRIPDQFADLLAEKVAALFDLPLDRVAKIIDAGAKIRAMNPITNSPIGATAAGQEAAKLAATLDATFTVLGEAGALPGDSNPIGIGTNAMGLDGGVNGGGQSMQEDLNRG